MGDVSDFEIAIASPSFASLLGMLLCVLNLQFCMADPNRCPELVFYGYLRYLMLGSEDENYVIALPPELGVFFHFLSIFWSTFVIHFNKSCTPICLYLTPSEGQEKEIHAFVHQLEDQAKNTITIRLKTQTSEKQN